MLDALKKEHEEKMKKVLQDLAHTYSTIRTGRASVALVDGIHVDAYGSQMPLIQLASVSTPDARTIAVQPFDVSQIGAIEKAFLASDLGITPNNDGKVIRLNIPALTEERRKEMVKLAHKYAEDHRVAVRQVRQHFNETIKKMEKDHELSQDDMHRLRDKEQKVTDEYNAKIGEEMAKKEAEIMEV